MKYRADVDVLRALAVSLVLAHHYGWLSGGFVGVDVFFVLSAYLISSLLRASRAPSLSTFYVRRVRRLFPALFVTLCAALLLAFALEDVPTRDTSLGVLSSMFSVSNYYFASTVDYFAPTYPNLLLHTWSLSVEEQFYLLWPLVFRVLQRRPAAILLLGVLLLLVTQLALAHYPRHVFFGAPFRAFEFLAGAYASFHHHGAAATAGAAATPSPSPSPWRLQLRTELGFSLGLLAIVLPSCLYSASTPFPALTALPPVLGTVGVLLSSSSRLGARLQRRAVLYLGRISYSVYLLHWPLLVAARTLLAVEQLSAIQSALALALTLLCACALHTFVETPLRCASDSTTAAVLTPHWLLPPALLLAAALYGVHSSSAARLCECNGSASASLLSAITTHAVSGGASNASASSPFDARTRTLGAPRWSTSSPYSLVIGDSHASVLAPFFAYLGARYRAHVQLRALPACSPLYGVHKVRVSIGVGQSSVSLAQLQQCERAVDEWRAHVNEAAVRRVFLVSRWSTALQPGEYFSRGPLAEYRFRDAHHHHSQTRVPSLNESRALFERALRHTVREMRARGKQVVIVGEPPDLGRGTFNCKRWLRRLRRAGGAAFEQQRWTEREQPAACVGARRALVMARLRYVNDVIGAVANETGARALLLSDYLCDNARWDARYCRVVSGGGVLYRDSDHVSELGAVYLATRWESDRRGWFPREWTPS